ncbi:MAG: hypothetical protein AAGU15_01205 [Anaerolineaceae bacterium]|jgi:mannose/fructose/sorbose-specific phosphotransferase system IIA component
MYKIIVFTHGDLSESLKKTAELISGRNDNVDFYGIPLGCDTAAMLGQVVNSIKMAEESDKDVLIFTDLFFGTPFNLLMTIVGKYKFSHIAGVNLPMLLEAMSMQDQKGLVFEDVVNDLVSKGKQTIVNCDKFVKDLVKKEG